MNVLLTTAGTRGDMQPMVALALGLRARGHSVKVCCSPDGMAHFQAHGLDAIPGGPEIRPILVEKAALAQDRPLETFRSFIGLFDALAEGFFDAMLPLQGWPDIIVGAGLVLPAPSLAELWGIPYRLAVFCPVLLPSAAHPPLSVPWQGLPGWMNRAMWWGQNLILERAVARALRARRAALGLPALRNHYAHICPPGRLLIATAAALSPCPTDYDATPAQTGFWMLPEEPVDVLPADLRQFVEDAPTVYIGFGSMPDPNPAQTTALLLDAIQRTNVQVLIHDGWAGLGDTPHLPTTCRVIGPTPHSALFPLLSGVIHHGGSGTTATALRAGTPQVAIPHLLDQFYWGEHIHRAGLGPPPIRRSRLTATLLSDTVEHLTSNNTYQSEANRISTSIHGQKSVEAAIKMIEFDTRH